VHARRKGITCRAVSPAVSDGECFSETGGASRRVLWKTSPSRLLLRRRASATVARDQGRQGLINVPSAEKCAIHEALAANPFGWLARPSVASTAHTSHRNYPGSCSQREPVRAGAPAAAERRAHRAGAEDCSWPTSGLPASRTGSWMGPRSSSRADATPNQNRGRQLATPELMRVDRARCAVARPRPRRQGSASAELGPGRTGRRAEVV
jgi:hypothetical protein